MSILSWIKQAISRGTTEDGPLPLTQLEYKGKPDQAVNLTPYGVYSRAPDGSIQVVLPIEDGGDIKYAIAQKFANRFDGLEKGEVAIGNAETGKFIYFKADGSIVSHELIVDGNLDVSGDADLGGGLTASDATLASILFSAHTHVAPSGGGPTGPPV